MPSHSSVAKQQKCAYIWPRPHSISTWSAMGPSYLQSVLPPEVLLSILQFLPSVDKLRLRLTCCRMHELVGNPNVWCVASFDHDQFTSRKALDTVLQLCAPDTRKLEIDTRWWMTRFPWARFMKHLKRISSNLSHLSLLGVEVPSKQLNMILSSCPALSHLRIELIPKKSFTFTAELCQSLKSLELHADDLSSFTTCNSSHTEIISSVVNDWVNKNCHPSQLVISHGTLTDGFPISSFMWSLCKDIHPPPEARGQLRVCVDGSLSIFPSYPYFEVLVENSPVSCACD